MGHEFNSLVLALLQAGGHPPKIAAEAVEQIRALEGEWRFETYFSQSCQNCPEVVQALNAISVLNPHVRHVAIDGAAFPEETAAREIMAVPSVFLNGKPFGQGRMSLEEILQKLDTGASARDAERLNAKAPYDVLIVGGGPAGAAAAIYAARKGIRTGHRRRTVRRPDQRHARHREFDLGRAHRGAQARQGARDAGARPRRRRDERPDRGRPDPRRRPAASPRSSSPTARRSRRARSSSRPARGGGR